MKTNIDLTKLLKAFPGSFINDNLEVIFHREANEYFGLKNCESELDVNKLIVCQSKASDGELADFINREIRRKGQTVIINPLGEWTGGPDVDSGATNRKLGSDMFDCITGGGLHGKDLSKADVSINIYAFLKAQQTGEEVRLCCAIGDSTVDGKPYSEIVEIARKFIKELGGFEKFAEWGYPTNPPQISIE